MTQAARHSRTKGRWRRRARTASAFACLRYSRKAIVPARSAKFRAPGLSGAEKRFPLAEAWKRLFGEVGATVSEMPNWTKRNFDELRDVSPPDVHVQWRFAREALRSPELGVSRFTYEPGARMPWGHRHRVQEEAYVVVAGSGRAMLDDELVELSAWDVLRVAPAVIRSFEAGPEGLDMICIGGRKPRGGDTERFQDFWN